MRFIDSERECKAMNDELMCIQSSKAGFVRDRFMELKDKESHANISSINSGKPFVLSNIQIDLLRQRAGGEECSGMKG